MTTALEGGEGSTSCPGRSLPPGKTRYLLYRRLGGPQGRSGQVRKISPPPVFDPGTVQPVSSRYATRSTLLVVALQYFTLTLAYILHLIHESLKKYLSNLLKILSLSYILNKNKPAHYIGRLHFIASFVSEYLFGARFAQI